MSVSVTSARKSIFNIPSASISFATNCVVMSSPFLESGTLSAIRFRQITTPAACIPVCLGIPSICRAISITRRRVWSSSYIAQNSAFLATFNSESLPSNCWRLSGSVSSRSFFSAFSILRPSKSLIEVLPSIILVSLSVSEYGTRITLPTSLMEFFAAIVPNVTI